MLPLGPSEQVKHRILFPAANRSKPLFQRKVGMKAGMKVGMNRASGRRRSGSVVIPVTYCRYMASIDNHQVPTDTESYGESARVVLAALSKSENLGTTPTGMHQFEFSLTPEETGPVFRALMRAEAALLIADSEAFKPTGPLRTPDQRRADALLDVVTSAAAALSS